MLNLSSNDPYQIKRVITALNRCQKIINQALKIHKIDSYMALYLGNMVFQMVRESLGELAIRCYHQNNYEPPWQGLINTLPELSKEIFISLDQLSTKAYTAKSNNEYTINNKFQ